MRVTVLGLSLVLVGCGAGANQTPPQTPASAPPPATTETHAETPPPPGPPKDPFAMPGDLRDEPPTLLQSGAVEPKDVPWTAAPKGFPAAPKSCDAFVKHAAKGGKCADRAAAMAKLDEALGESDAVKRDEKLAAAEACTALPTGLVRALRADLAPPECGDALVEPLVAKPAKTLPANVYTVLVGQGLAGRLARLGGGAPAMKAPFDKPHVLEFIKGPLVQWFTAQANAIEDASKSGAKLVSYGRGIVAIEAGMADLRLVDAARSIPLPEEFAKDAELKDVYYGALEQALEPRKARGRDAALVGLADFAAVGALHDDRVGRARALLAKLYGGRRIDALDALALPPLAAASYATPEQRLAARLPTFYASQLFDGPTEAKPDMLRPLLERGFPAPARAAFREGTPEAQTAALVARARLDLGRLYWRAFDFDRAAAAAEKAKDDDASQLVLALALALRTGPQNAADMMRHAPLTTLGIADTSALDAIAKSPRPTAPLAAYDAALLRAISPPDGADAAYWNDVADRFAAAAAKLTDPNLQSAAKDRQRDAKAIAESMPHR